MNTAASTRLSPNAFIASILLLIAVAPCLGQRNAEQMVPFKQQGEVRLESLLKELAPHLGTQFLYTSEIGRRQVTVKTPPEIPLSVVPILLGSILKAENLAVGKSEVPGWKRIVDVTNMPKFSRATDQPGREPDETPASPITRVFVLQNIKSAGLTNAVLLPFLSSKGAKVQEVAENNTLIVTDFESNIRTVESIIALIDRPQGETIYQFYDVKHQRSETLSTQVGGMLEQKGTPEGGQGKVKLFNESQGNRIIVAGRGDLVEQAIDLLEKLDISLGIKTRVYKLKNVSAERMNKIVRGYLTPQDTDRLYQSTVDEDGNMLVVRATDKIHTQIDKLVDELDKPVKSSQSPIRFYKLKNANAVEVLYSLLALQEAAGGGSLGSGFGTNGFGASPFSNALYGAAGVQQASFLSGALGTPGMIRQSPSTPAQAQADDGFSNNLGDDITELSRRYGLPNPLAPSNARGNNGSGTGTTNGSNSTGSALPGAAGLGAVAALNPGFGGSGFSQNFAQSATLPGGARVSADVASNSIIVVAPANVQPMYARLIESLDQRRPQVLIEAKIVAVDTSDNFGLGVEVSVGDRTGARRMFKFTSFGLSEVDRDTGNLRIIPTLGFNGTLVDPDVADVVVQALAAHSRATVLAAPKILVNDNSTGKLESVVSVPFQSVNASETVATTSLGGNQQAGTIITVTPHINEDDHLQLEFDVEFSTFSGTGDNNLPPPRQIDRVGSIVTIPHGKTVIVGGLRRVGESHSFAGVPWIEKIPVLRELNSRTTEELTTTSFFLFIRPRVLRDSRFQDLRYLSDRDASQAGLPGDFPLSSPLMIP